jgi:hypothetical protein
LDEQMVGEQQNDAFAEFVEEHKPIRLGIVDPNQPRTAWLLTLEGRWQMCMCEAGDDRTLILKGAAALDERIDDVAERCPVIGGSGTSTRGTRRRSRSRSIERERSNAWLFRDLATLRTDIQVFDSIDDLRWSGPTEQFAALAARLESPTPSAAP